MDVPSLGARVLAAAGLVVLKITTWRARCRGRRQLACMSARQLADIGVTRLDAIRESRKPFWRE